ncbi:hypothetical protein GUJ93_ZPchr0004g40198 [Zizania palustris]|uniref:Protein LURP-one-related 6 n=1 Tax=Zizania palustris TaxID=103762 RepID=A0A8J5SPU1_ZIZPA|nr:hypothetical protein GUJ93_ZPchr0004g40198 [Zizania palustris]
MDQLGYQVGQVSTIGALGSRWSARGSMSKGQKQVSMSTMSEAARAWVGAIEQGMEGLQFSTPKVQKLVYQLPFVPIIYIEICVIEVPESKVSKIFCSSTPTTLMIRRRPIVVNGGGFVVTDLSNNVVFIVDGCGTLGSKGELLVKDGEGEPILFISRKMGKKEQIGSKDFYNVVVQSGCDKAFIIGVMAVLDNIYGESTRCR